MDEFKIERIRRTILANVDRCVLEVTNLDSEVGGAIARETGGKQDQEARPNSAYRLRGLRYSSSNLRSAWRQSVIVRLWTVPNRHRR